MDELIFSYTRKQAIADEVLIDITWISKQVGFKYPCCVNERLYHHYGEDEDTRDVALANLLIELLLKAHTSKEADRIYTKVDGEEVVLHVGPDDDGNPCLTLCHSSEL